MFSVAVYGNSSSSISSSITISTSTIIPIWNTITSTEIRFGRRTRRRKRNSVIQFNPRAFLNKPPIPKGTITDQPSVIHNSLRVLEWDKVSHSVASFAGTSLGQEATKAQLWSLNKTYEESLRLQEETNAAVEMHKYGCTMDFSGIDVQLVKSAIQHARRGLHVGGSEAIALVGLLQYAESLQFNVKAAIKDDADWLQRFMPLAEIIMGLVISGSLVKFIQQLIDEDGSVKDSASTSLKRSREQVRLLERKLYHLMEGLIRKETNETSSLEVSNIDGRWCIKSGADLQRNFDGLLLSRCGKHCGASLCCSIK